MGKRLVVGPDRVRIKKQGFSEHKGYYLKYEVTLSEGFSFQDVLYFCDKGVVVVNGGDSNKKDNTFCDWDKFIKNYLDSRDLVGENFVSIGTAEFGELIKNEMKEKLKDFQVQIEDKINVQDLELDYIYERLTSVLSKKDVEDISRLNFRIIEDLSEIKNSLKEIENFQIVIPNPRLSFWIEYNLELLLPIIDKLKFYTEILTLRDLMILHYLNGDFKQATDVKLQLEKTGLLHTEFQLRSLEKLDSIKAAIDKMHSGLKDSLNRIASNQSSINEQLSSLNSKMNYSLALQTVNTLQLRSINKKLD